MLKCMQLQLVEDWATLLDCEEVKTSRSQGRPIKKWQEQSNASQRANQVIRYKDLSVLLTFSIASYHYLSSREWDMRTCILSLPSLTAPLRWITNRPNPNPCTHTATPGARLEEPINVPDGDGWGIAKLPTKSWMLTNEQRDNWAGCDSPECC